MLTRGASLRAAGLCAASSLAIVASCGEVPARPDILLVVVATLRADRTTVGGYRRNTTPALARLGATGAVFERAFAMSSWTLPSGRYASEVAERAERILADDARRAAFTAALPDRQGALLDDAAYRGIKERLALYDTKVLKTDRAFERVLRALERRRERQPGRGDLVVFTSDHGEGLWDRAAMPGEPHKPEAYFPWLYSDHGLTLNSEQVHVPLVFAGTGVPAGHRETRPVCLLDVLPTVLRLANLARPAGLDGPDLFDGDGIDRRRHIFGVTSRFTSVTASGRHRLHVPREHVAERSGLSPVLYDLESDPFERAPFTGAALSADLTSLAALWRNDHGGTLETVGVDDTARRALLGRMGYVGGEADR